MGGHCAVGAAAAAASVAPSSTPSAEQYSSAQATPPIAVANNAEAASLRARFGSHMDVVRLIFGAWRKFAELYHE